MATDSTIEWTDKTWSPVIGCDRVSPGCDKCYAIGTARIRESHPNPKIAAAFAGTTERTDAGVDWSGKVNLLDDRLTQPLRWKKPARVFVNSMSDLFHAEIPDEFIARVFAVMALTPQHTFQVLTKRHARMRSLVSSRDFLALVDDAREELRPGCGDFTWPLPNVWLGVSVENQRWADLRIPALLETPAAVRFLSCEPLLGPVGVWDWIDPGTADTDCDKCGDERFADEIGVGHERLIYDDAGVNVIDEQWCDGPSQGTRPRRIDWVIVGGESGPGARPMDVQWATGLVKQCRESGTAVFVKQLGAVWARVNGASDSKGGDPGDWPVDLRVREYPAP